MGCIQTTNNTLPQDKPFLLYLPEIDPDGLKSQRIAGSVDRFHFEQKQKLFQLQNFYHWKLDHRWLTNIPIDKQTEERQFSQCWQVTVSKDGSTMAINGYMYGGWGLITQYELTGTQTSENCWSGTGLYSWGGGEKIPEEYKRIIQFNWQLEPKTNKPKEFDEKFRTIILLRELPKTTGLD